MIKIERGAYPADTLMDKKKDKELKNFKSSNSEGLKPLWQENKVKRFLHQSQSGKCCYCERIRDEKAETDIEHFRPKAELKENPNHSGYWWLAYSWDNLLISCKKCNNRKNTRFPLKDENKRAFFEHDDINKEEPVLINPLTENPEDFIIYDIPENDKEPLMIKAVGKCERGDETVKLTGINDKELLRERAEKFRDCCVLNKCFLMMKGNNPAGAKEICKEIQRKTDSKSQFAGLARFYFSQAGLSDK